MSPVCDLFVASYRVAPPASVEPLETNRLGLGIATVAEALSSPHSMGGRSKQSSASQCGPVRTCGGRRGDGNNRTTIHSYHIG